jgi:hypothetical protein
MPRDGWKQTAPNPDPGTYETNRGWTEADGDRQGRTEQMDKESRVTACAGCGTAAENTPVTWICSVENGELR